jgi:nucleoside-specific outer membrane channel protein Tsx
MTKLRLSQIFLLFLNALLASTQVMAWSTTEVHLQYGHLKQVGTQGAESRTQVITLQNAHGWKYGQNFFFLDYVDATTDGKGKNPFNSGSDSHLFYGEWYSTISLGKVTGAPLTFGPIKDIGVTVGVNVAEAVDSWWLLPGVTLSLDLPHFDFAKITITGFLNHSFANKKDAEFKVLDEGDSYMVDFSWMLPFTLGNTKWSLTGHVEYIDGRNQTKTFGQKQLSPWVLAQPQLRLDLGDLLFDKADQLYAGIEYQYWRNKLGEKGTHDNEAQLLAVWRF